MVMGKGIRAIIAGCALGLASQALGTMYSGDGRHFDEFDSCHSHLHALVAILEETAQLEGRVLVVEWNRDGSVTLYCADFSQHIWCQDEELHIDYSDPAP